MTTLDAGPARHARIHLAPNRSLIAAVTEAMDELRWPSATLQILGGPLQQAVYHCSILTPDGPRWIDYGPPRDTAHPAWLVMGSATYGRARDDTPNHPRPALHCHAVLSSPDGIVGGHLSPDRCIIGALGLVAYAISAPAAGFRIMPDQTTGFDLLTPA